MTETRKAWLLARIEGAARDVLACVARLREGGGADDVWILLESARDAHTDALELSLSDAEEAAA